MQQMRISEQGKNFIHRMEEGDEPALNAYRCQAGVLTIGWGHTTEAGVPAVEEGMTITREDADIIFARDIGDVVEDVNKILRDAGITAAQHEYDALVSFAFNLGVDTLGSSTAFKWFTMGKPKTAVGAALCLFQKIGPDGNSRYCSDLADRRYREAKMFVEGIYQEITN
jgi:lysozyme